MSEYDEGITATDAINSLRLQVDALAMQRDSALAEIERLREDNEKCRELLHQKVMDSTMLTGMLPVNGGLDIGFEGGACHLLAAVFAKQFAESGADNYLEMSFESSAIMPGESFVVRLQKVSGKTPHMFRVEAESERDQLRARVAELELACASFVSACDTAPPIELMKHIAAACENCRAALGASHD